MHWEFMCFLFFNWGAGGGEHTDSPKHVAVTQHIQKIDFYFMHRLTIWNFFFHSGMLRHAT